MKITAFPKNTIIICENSYKKNILKKLTEVKEFLNIKFFTKKEFFNEYLFNYDEKTIYYLVSHYQIKVEIAKLYLDNLFFIDENHEYKSYKLNYLKILKQDLREKNLLIYNNDFKKYLKKYHILVMGYPYLNTLEQKVFKDLQANILNINEYYNNEEVLEFNDIEEEINFVLKKIGNLLHEGVSINKIKLMNVDNEYYNILNRLCNFYNIPLKLDINNSLYGNNIVSKFLENYNSDISKSINSIINYDSDIVNKIIAICNKYNFIEDYEKVKDLIIYDLKNTQLKTFNLKNYLEIINFEDDFEPDDYIFLMNFNAGKIPNYIKDEDYITDNIKEEVGLENTITINKKIKKYTIDKIKSIKNICITYKLKNSKQAYFPSPLINDLNLKVIKPKDDILQSFSKINDILIYAKLEENIEKYGDINDNYYIYQNSLGDISYKSFDNKYHKINQENFKEYLQKGLTLSYSSLNNFNKCSFRYYIANILKLDKYEENFESFIGLIFHNVLEKCFNQDLLAKDEVEKYIKESGKVLSAKEKFFTDKIIEDIDFVIKVLKNQLQYISLDKSLYEQEIEIDKSRDIKVTFKGYIDKILYKEKDDTTLVAIIDYKTGFVDTTLNYVPYGLNLQLPIYLYLIKKSNILKNPIFTGFYLQYILDKDITRDGKVTYAEKRWNNLKLVGYSNSNVHNLSEFDNSFENSNLIKSMKVKVNGDFASTAKILNDDEIIKLITLTEENIDNAITKILDADFQINPKKIGFENDMGCKFCKFQDLCFKKENDYLILDDIKSLNFLGGENQNEVD